MTTFKKLMKEFDQCFDVLRREGVNEIPPRHVLEPMIDTTSIVTRAAIAKRYADRYKRRGSLVEVMIGIRQPIHTVEKYSEPGSLIARMR